MKNSFERRGRILKLIYSLSPFLLKGDLADIAVPIEPNYFSCLIPASQRSDQLDGILQDLARQTLSPKNFEVIVLNDGGGEDIQRVVETYRTRLNIIYSENTSANRNIGFLRNRTIELSRGEFILFLDDDTRLWQDDFLEKARLLFQQTAAELIMPEAHASYSVLSHRYAFLDSYSFANRCCFHRRKILSRFRGFRDINAYEDVELGIRYSIAGVRVQQCADLKYLHPPLFYRSLQKPLATGQALLQLRKYYPFLVWLLLYLNSIRFLIYIFWPFGPKRQWFKLSLGIFLALFTKRAYRYA